MSALIRPLKWFYHEFGIVSVHNTGRNAYLIILARTCRMFAFGINSLILAIFFSALQFSDHRIGLFMTLTLFGDLILGTFLTLIADRVGRRRILLAGSLMMIISGLIFAIFENFWILLLAAIIGVVSVTGGDFGPFRSIEESMLAHLTTPSTRADVLAWYVTISTLGTAAGSEAAGRIFRYLQEKRGYTDANAYHALFWIYTIMGFVNVMFALSLTDACEVDSKTEDYVQVPQDEHDRPEASSGHSAPNAKILQEPKSLTDRAKHWLAGNLSQISAPTRSIMYKLWFLLAVDSLADGMVPYSLTNYYMDEKFHPTKSVLGDVTSISYFLGAIGSSFAGPLARRIGLINTMVFTHVPSSTAVLLFPAPPFFWLTAGLLLIRSAFNPMDQAPRSAFIAAVVKPEERTAVMGITATFRTLASMAGPSVTGLFAAGNRFWIAFVVAGVARLLYDFGLWAMFVNMDVSGNGPASKAADRTLQDREEIELESPRLSLESASSSEQEMAEIKRSVSASLGQEQLSQGGLARIRSRSPHRTDHDAS